MKKVKKLERPWGNMSLICILLAFFQWLKIRDIKKLQQDIENDPIIKDQMANLGCLFVCTFGNYLVPVLVAAHTVNNVFLAMNLRTRVMRVTITFNPCLGLRV